jgi:rSAM/selenodomain-associated transferase 2
MNNSPKISIIIPARNEAHHIQATLRSVLVDPHAEIIVVDGGSTDATRSLALAAGVTVLSTLPDRARQQNLGAAAASGKILFFLHADTLAPPDYARLIRQTLQQPDVSAGAFSLAIANDHPGLKAISYVANVRSRWLQLPYGDQGLFLPARLFFRLGGFPSQPIMEDFALVRQLQKHGRIITLSQTVLTSHRRWQHLGVWRTFYLNQLMIFGYYVGVAPATLAGIYRQQNKAEKKSSKII